MSDVFKELNDRLVDEYKDVCDYISISKNIPDKYDEIIRDIATEEYTHADHIRNILIDSGNFEETDEYLKAKEKADKLIKELWSERNVKAKKTNEFVGMVFDFLTLFTTWKGVIVMRNILCSSIGVITSCLTYIFGGWNSAMTTLVIFMGIDYMSGLIVAGVFKNSAKTDKGGLSSNVGFKGLIRKGMILLFVLIGARLDLVLNLHTIKNAVIITFLANELLSIVENAGLMGIPIPDAITNGIEMLSKKNNKQEKKGGDKRDRK